MFNYERFKSAFAALGVEARPAAFDVLSNAYSQPTRHYHNRRHIEELLTLFDEHESLAGHGAEVELGIWYHDVIYDATRGDNEARSAALAAEHLGDCGIAKSTIQRITAMIEATKTHVADSADGQLLIDLDLSILGADDKRFGEYDQAIRREYAFVPPADFAARRQQVLGHFLARPRIYETPALFEQFETKARANLRRAIAAAASDGHQQEEDI